MATAVGTLQAPFLASDADRGGQAEGTSKSMVQRVAGLHWPNPTAALLVIGCLTSCVCLLGRSSDKTVEASDGSIDLSSPGAATVVGQPPLGISALPSEPGALALVATIAVAMLLLAFQYVSEKLLARSAVQALRSLGIHGSDLKVEFGTMRVLALSGCLEIRNCVVRCPRGFRSDHMVHVRVISVEFDLPRCFQSLFSEVEIRCLRLDGVNIVLERGLVSSNLEAAAAKLQDAVQRQAAAQADLRVRRVVVTAAEVCEVGSLARVAIPDMTLTEFSKEQAGGANAMAAHILMHLQKAAAANLTRQQRST